MKSCTVGVQILDAKTTHSLWGVYLFPVDGTVPSFSIFISSPQKTVANLVDALDDPLRRCKKSEVVSGYGS